MVNRIELILINQLRYQLDIDTESPEKYDDPEYTVDKVLFCNGLRKTSGEIILPVHGGTEKDILIYAYTITEMPYPTEYVCTFEKLNTEKWLNEAYGRDSTKNQAP